MTQTANAPAIPGAAQGANADLIRALQTALQESRQQNEELRENLRSIKEGMMKAGGVVTVRRLLDDGKLIASSGKSEIVLGLSDPSLQFQIGDAAQTDINKMLATENLGCASEFASDTVEFVAWGDDGLATVRHNGDLRVYIAAEALRNGGGSGVEPGAVLLANNDTRFVFKRHSCAVCEDYATAVPSLVYAAGRDVLARIEETLFDPLFADPRKRTAGMLVILSGPAGSGKSHAALALAQRRGVAVVRFTTEDVSSSFVSESSRAIKRLFDQAIKQAEKGERVLILCEECNSLAARRTGFSYRCAASQEMANITSTLLTQLDRLVQRGSGLPIAVGFTTNVINDLDPAIRSRASAEIQVTYIDREYGRELLAAHLDDGTVELAGGEAEVDRLVDILFDSATPLVQVEAEIGQTTERFRLTPADTMLPRLVAGTAADLRRLDSPVRWADAACAAHSRILAHARQVASSPDHYVPYADHPFAGDPDLRIRRAFAVYPEATPREFLARAERG